MISKELFREFYNKSIYCVSNVCGDDSVNGYLKCEHDLFLDGLHIAR